VGTGPPGAKPLRMDEVIPTLDLRDRSDPVRREAFLAGLRRALFDPGAFYLTGHGIHEEDSDAMMQLARRFFALPAEDRDAIDIVHSPHFRGYTQVGYERTQGAVDWREQLDVGLELPARKRVPGDPAYLELQGPNQWPAALPELRPAVLGWMDGLGRVADALLAAICEAYGLAPSTFRHAFAVDPHVHLKIIRYPASWPVSSEQGVGAHKDYGFLTLLLQDDVGGLQIADGRGGFSDVPPRRGTFIVNLGELFEVATGGVMTATMHRVRRPPSGAERISIPYFHNPRLDYSVAPIDLPKEHAQARQPVDPTNPLFAEYGRNALKGWLRAHPRVAERYYGAPALSD